MDDVVATPTAGEAMRKSMDNEVRRRVRATVVTPRFGWTSSPRQRPSARHDASLLTSLVPHPQFLYTRSQADLLSATSLNPTPTTGSSTIPRTSAPTPSSDRSIDRSIRLVPSFPTVRRPSLSRRSDLPPRFVPRARAVPPPIAALAGNIGERHVLVFLGLPLVGKRTIALRLKRYLRFFHGAKCKAFDVSKFAGARADDSDGVESGAEGANARSMEFFEHLRDFLESTDESPATDADADANGTLTRLRRTRATGPPNGPSRTSRRDPYLPATIDRRAR